MKKVLVLVGPPAVGKTALSIELAQCFQGEIISGDSIQVYRGLDIGSGKITEAEKQGIPHYLIDELMPEEEFNIVLFQKLAKQYMQEIYTHGRIPILAGGTGFYIQSVLYDIDFSKEDASAEIRNELEAFAKREGNLALHNRLLSVDPVSANAIHPNNVKRVIRALEFYQLNGYAISEHNKEERQKKSPYNFAYFVLNDERSRLYERIEQRVDKMLECGLLDEVKKLKAMGYHKDMVSMQGLGYKELLAYLDGEITYDEAVYILKRDTRHFAKRQLTWFRREDDVIWLNKDEYSYQEDQILEKMITILKEKKIL